ncbi:MAG: DUF4010 domain-containing protein, partial [Bacteroidales bacterium]|nr:DUF4010 domain-containing protein [Bacteroidales bacterium]
FVLVTVFSLLIGLSQRKVHVIDHRDHRIFGTDRTFTFIGIFGYILYLLHPKDLLLFIIGALILASFLIVYYLYHLRNDRDYGITSILIALITYCLGPLTELQPLWLVLIVVVTVLIFAELKESFISLSEKIGKDEFITLAKFLIIAGVILPIVPDTPFVEGLSLTPYRIWLAVVVVSGISYASYLLKKYLLQRSGILVAGLLGGLYSSTATTIILAKKCRQEPGKMTHYMSAIFLATSMMYLRVLILILIFNMELFLYSWPWFLILMALSAGTGLFLFLFRKRDSGEGDTQPIPDKNPLEFQTALIFTALFVLLSFITYAVLNRFGTPGLNVLSFLVGMVDIDPFLLSLFEEKFAISIVAMTVASFQAIISNNLMKMIYAMIFSDKKTYLYLLSGFLFIVAINILIILML